MQALKSLSTYRWLQAIDLQGGVFMRGTVLLKNLTALGCQVRWDDFKKTQGTICCSMNNLKMQLGIWIQVLLNLMTWWIQDLRLALLTLVTSPPPKNYMKLNFKKLCLKNKLIDLLSTCRDFKKSVSKSLSLNEYLFPVLHKNRNPEWDCEA